MVKGGIHIFNCFDVKIIEFIFSRGKMFIQRKVNAGHEWHHGRTYRSAILIIAAEYEREVKDWLWFCEN